MRYFLVLLAAAGNQADSRAVDLKCTEYSVVTFQLLRGAPEPKGLPHPVQGEHNQKAGTWASGGKRAMTVCGYLFPASRPVVDVTPDAPKAGEELICRIVAPGDDAQGRPIEKYVYAWKRFENGKWVAADVPADPRLPGGKTQDGEIWACSVLAVEAGGAKSVEMLDQVEIGKAKPGDSRKNFTWGWTHGQWRHCRGYLKFDLRPLQGKKVRSARLRLFCDVHAPPFLLHAFAVSDAWKDREITWVNQPLPFPTTGKPVGTIKMDYGPKPTPENPASASKSSAPVWGEVCAPAWRETEITEYVRAALGEGRPALSVCLAAEPQERKDHARVIVWNEFGFDKGEKDRGDMSPRLSVEVE